MRMIVADASPLIMLARSRMVGVVSEVAGDVLVPRTVWEECTVDSSRPGAAELIAGHEAGLIDIREAAWTGPAISALDAGELAAIALAASLRCPVLMDERLGRRIASEQGVSVIGSAGLLLAAKRQGRIPAVRPILETWAGWGYSLSDTLKAAVFAHAGE